MEVKNHSTRIVKTINRHRALDVIRRNGPVTIENIMYATHLSRPTVLNIIENLQENHIIERAGFAESPVGRQPVLYTINNSTYFAIGIDFEFPPIHLIVTNLSGAVCYQKNWNSSYDTEKQEIIQSLIQNIQLAMDTLGITTDNIIGISIGIPGTINIAHNTSEIISRIPEWNNTPLSEILSEYFPVPILVRNDAHLISLAIQDLPIMDSSNFMYIAYRTGIGMAIIQNGKLFEGRHGNSGYIGHTTVDINGDLCSCGKRGCLETFSSKTTIENKYAQAKNLDKRVSFDSILQLADNGDSIAADILETAGMYFGLAIANSVKILDIPLIIIDDLNCSKEHIFMRSIQNTVNRYCSSYALESIQVIPHQHREDNYALGAALFILDTFFQEPKLKPPV